MTLITQTPLGISRANRGRLETLLKSAIPDMTDEQASVCLKRGPQLQLLIADLLQMQRGPTEHWYDDQVLREKRILQSFFGFIPEGFGIYEQALDRIGEERVMGWMQLGLHPHYIPKLEILDGDKFPGQKFPISKDYFGAIADGQLSRTIDGTMSKLDVARMDGVVALIDIRQQPQSVSNGYDRDSKYLGQTLKGLRDLNLIKKPREGYATSRFGTEQPNEWVSVIQAALQNRPEFFNVQWRFETYLEYWYLGHVLRHLDGLSNTGVWLEEMWERCQCWGGYLGDAESGLSCFHPASRFYEEYRIVPDCVALRPIGIISVLK